MAMFTPINFACRAIAGRTTSSPLRARCPWEANLEQRLDCCVQRRFRRGTSMSLDAERPPRCLADRDLGELHGATGQFGFAQASLDQLPLGQSERTTTPDLLNGEPARCVAGRTSRRVGGERPLLPDLEAALTNLRNLEQPRASSKHLQIEQDRTLDLHPELIARRVEEVLILASLDRDVEGTQPLDHRYRERAGKHPARLERHRTPTALSEHRLDAEKRQLRIHRHRVFPPFPSSARRVRHDGTTMRPECRPEDPHASQCRRAWPEHLAPRSTCLLCWSHLSYLLKRRRVRHTLGSGC